MGSEKNRPQCIMGRTESTRTMVMAATAFMVVCACTNNHSGVEAFATLRPMVMKVDLLGDTRAASIEAAQLLSIERLDSKQHQGVSPGSPLSMISQDQQEFELSVGHAMDVLRSDYPEILTVNPDFSIYDANLELIDPSGVHLYGVKNYKAAFRLMHTVVGVFYCPERSGLTFRMCFDKARQNIRIHWNAEIIPKAIFGGYKTTLHVDGISVYEISRNSGNITQHRIERLVINDNFVMPEEGLFASLRGYAVKSKVDGIPAFNAGGATFTGKDDSNRIPKMPSIAPFQNFAPQSRSLLFNGKEDDNKLQLSSMESSSLDGKEDDSKIQLSSMESSSLEWEKLEKKNVARKKFGLAPLTPEEFEALQEEVAELDSQIQKRKVAQTAEIAEKKAKENNPGFFKKLFGNALEDTCETNFDCEWPEICCDFGFKKQCCSSGMRILNGPPPQSRAGQMDLIPVIASPRPQPPDYGDDLY